jgi:hypothetical protein
MPPLRRSRCQASIRADPITVQQAVVPLDIHQAIIISQQCTTSIHADPVTAGMPPLRRSRR